MVDSIQGERKRGYAVFVSKLPDLVMSNWKALGFEGLPTYRAIADAIGTNPRTISKWMQVEPFAQLDSETAGALIKFFRARNVDCTLNDLVEIDWRSEPLHGPRKRRGRKPKS